MGHFVFKEETGKIQGLWFQISKNLFLLSVCFFLVLSYRLIYNQFYFKITEEVEVSSLGKKEVYPLGEIVGIYTKCNGIFVIDTCEIENSLGQQIDVAGNEIKTGDYIMSINGISLNCKEDMVKLVEASEGKDLNLLISRNGTNFQIILRPELGKNGKYMLGIWVKDDLAGVGTITYFTNSGEFAALGHGMGDGETKNLLAMNGGDVYVSNVVGIQKGEKGEPGEVKGLIYYGKVNHIGELYNNTGKGIYGKLDVEDLQSYKLDTKPYKVADKQEILQGPAQIISEVSGSREVYDVEITYVDYLAMDSNKGLHIRVTDPDLLELTGGIIQGMSGSPIIQNGKLIGAVTHVLINDPEQGYGIFLDEMMKVEK